VLNTEGVKQQLALESGPLNLSTKPSGGGSSGGSSHGKSKGIWSPASLCEEEEQSRRRHHNSKPVINSSSSPERCDGDDSSPPDSPTGRPLGNSSSSIFVRSPAALFRPFDPAFYLRSKSGGDSGGGGSSSWKAEDHHQASGQLELHRQISEESFSDSAVSVKDEDPPAHYCRGCDQAFPTHHALQSHVRQNHCGTRGGVHGGDIGINGGTGAYPCPRCPKVFEVSTNLEQHLASHHAARSFQVGDLRDHSLFKLKN